MSKTRRNEEGVILDNDLEPLLVVAMAHRAVQRRKARSLKDFNQLADGNQLILDEPLQFSAPGEQDEGNKLRREMAASTYIDAAQQSGLSAAELRHAHLKASKHFKQNEEAYWDAAREIEQAGATDSSSPNTEVEIARHS